MNTWIFVMQMGIMTAFDPLDVIDISNPRQQALAATGLIACMVIDLVLRRRASKLSKS